jgi:monoamine oxidase
VNRIRVRANGVHVESERVTIRARSAVVAVPPTVAGRIEYDPPLPGGRASLHEGMPPGTVLKALAFYDEPFWRDEGLNGFGITPDHPAGFTSDFTPPDGSPGVLAAFLWGRAADEVRRGDGAYRREAITGLLVRLFGEQASRLRDLHELDWLAEEWTRGCYAGLMPPDGWTRLGPDLRRAADPLHWAGSETSPVWMGYMEGAVRSGERVAEEILHRRARGP